MQAQVERPNWALLYPPKSSEIAKKTQQRIKYEVHQNRFTNSNQANHIYISERSLLSVIYNNNPTQLQAANHIATSWARYL
jgi:hypothetical protein